MKRIYLDSNILIAHFATDKSEEIKKKLVENALEVFPSSGTRSFALRCGR